MWTPTTRQQHSRPVTRYQTDLTDAEWLVIAPHLPKPGAMGRPREWPMREIINGIFYVMRAGCPWRLLPKDLPPWGTIYRWFAAWRDRRARDQPRPQARQEISSEVPGGQSISSSARARMAGGTVRPSALAVFRLIMNSNFVACWTGKSAGFAPLRMRSM
jgi:hypothetical protein